MLLVNLARNMGCLRSLIFFINLSISRIVILNLVAPIIAKDETPMCTEKAEYCWKCSDTTGTYKAGDKYEDNLKSLLFSFANNTENNSGFYNSSMGQDPNKVNAIALCRGDLLRESCQACLTTSIHGVLRNCSSQKEAIFWAEDCMVRYTYDLIFGIEKQSPVRDLPSPNSVDNSQQFGQVLNSLLGNLRDRAASGDSLQKYAAGHAFVPGAGTIYALVQCTPDIDKQNCSNCLKESILEIPTCCVGKDGARIIKPSCTLRFEAHQFFRSTADSLVEVSAPVPAAPAPNDAKKKSNTKQTVIIIFVVLAAFVTILSSICIFLRVRKRRVKLGEDENPDEVNLVESLQYDFETIRSATDDFSDANKLGQGGFGAVFKGRLFNGQTIAVKRLSKSSEQGDREFKNEIILLAQLQHRNLVRLLGFCLKAEERLLIYEYLPNKSLDHFIFDPKNHKHLDWETRYKIIGGIARGILYLHEDSQVRIIHRDLKANNILLDEAMNPKIADFGMARLFTDQTEGDTKTVVGTYGYMAPEYVLHGRFSVKTDVFSFGVLVLEIVSGKKIGRFENEEHLLTYVWRNWREDAIQNIIDPVLMTSSRIETIRCIHIGLLCVQKKVVDRPTLASIVSMLNSQSLALPVPSLPAFYMHHNTASDVSALTESDQSKSLSVYVSENAPSNITEPYPR